MDRPILLNDLVDAGIPALGVKVCEAQHVANLTTELQAVITAAAASAATYPMVEGFELAGGGGGNTVRGTLTITENQGWGFGTSIPAALAHVIIKTARNAPEIETVLAKAYAAIAAAATRDPYVWCQRIVGTGRDGSYVVGLLWSDGFPGPPTISTHHTPAQGPFLAGTSLLALTIPQAVGGLAGAQQFWRIEWGAAVNDVVGTGCKLRLELAGVPVVEFEQLGTAVQWQCNEHVYIHTQDTAGPSNFNLTIEPTVGGNGVNCRGAHLVATQLNYNLALS
jgi:hypothetical protein